MGSTSVSLVLAAAALAAAAVTVAPGVARAGTGAGLVRYLPDETVQVIVVDVAHARRGGAIGKLVQLMRSNSPRCDTVATGGVALDLAIDTFVAGRVDSSEDGLRRHHGVMIVDGKIGPILAHLKRPDAPAAQHDGVTYWSIDGGEVAILDHHLVITDPGEMVAIIDRARTHGAGGSSDTTQALRAALGATAGGGADVWGARVLEPEMRAGVSQATGVSPLWIGFSIAASARVSFELRAGFADPPTAELGASWLARMLVGPDAQFRPWLESIGAEFAESVSVEPDGTEARVSAAMSADEAEPLWSRFSLLW